MFLQVVCVQACISFMVLHHRDVLRTAEWKQMKRERSELANELLESVLAGEGPSSANDFSFSSSEESRTPTSSIDPARPQMRKRVRRVR